MTEINPNYAPRSHSLAIAVDCYEHCSLETYNGPQKSTVLRGTRVQNAGTQTSKSESDSTLMKVSPSAFIFFKRKK